MFKSIRNFFRKEKKINEMRKLLIQAKDSLPVEFNLSDTPANLEQFEEFIGEFELECAIDQLESIGDDLEDQGINLNPEFWQILYEVASTMELEQTKYYKAKIDALT